MIKADNPAGRLYLLIDAMRNGVNENSPVKDVIASHFEVDNETEWIEAYLDIRHLIEETKQTIEQLEFEDAEKAAFIDPVNTIREAFNPRKFFNSWKDVITNGAGVIVAFNQLKFVSISLSNSPLQEDIINSIDIQNLITEAETLIQELQDGNIPEDIQKLFDSKLDEIIQALKRYPVRGVEGLKDALEKALGALLLAFQRIRAASETDEDVKKTTKKFQKVLAGLGTIIAQVGAKKLIDKGIETLPELVETIESLIN